MFTKANTERGFDLIRFKDLYDSNCNIQHSSLATQDCIWLGIEDADPKIMASKTKKGGTGWVAYEIPTDVLLTTRMHLNRQQCFKLAKVLIKFALTGKLGD